MLRAKTWTTIALCGLAAAAACGDDTGTGGRGGEGGESTTTKTTTTGTPTTGSTTTSGSTTSGSTTSSTSTGMGGMGGGGTTTGTTGTGGGMQVGSDTCSMGMVVGEGSYQGTFNGFTNDYDPTDMGCTTFDEVGPDIAYELSIPAMTEIQAVVFPDTADAAIYLVTDCSSLSSCVAGSDEGFSGEPDFITYTNASNTPLTAWLIIDSFSASASGDYTLEINFGDESNCGDLFDNDLDGAFDCADTTTCQGTAACAPGAALIGAACTANTDCTATGGDPACLSQAITSLPGGYCSEWCNLMADDCSGDGVCTNFGLADGLCLDGCVADSDCRMGYYCDDSLTACWVAPTACAAPTVAMLGTNTGDTTSTLNETDSGCSSGNEQIFTFTPATSGNMTITLTSATDQGISVRSPSCADPGDELACVDAELGGTDEVLVVPVTAGTQYFIIIEAFNPGEEGPYSFTVAVM